MIVNHFRKLLATALTALLLYNQSFIEISMGMQIEISNSASNVLTGLPHEKTAERLAKHIQHTRR